MDPRIGNLWLIATCVVIVMISCCITGVACDVPDDVVYTDLHKTVKIGDSAVLKCQFRGTPSSVYWKKGDDPERSPTLVSWITGDPVTGVCVGERICQIMEMNAEFSLIIKEVSIAEQGQYVCRVENYKGIWIHNLTDISVFSPPKEPYPIINECPISPTDTETTCTISTNQSVEISCSASGYYPDIDLYFLHGTTRLSTKDTIEVTNLDGTKNKTLSAIATASKISHICVASFPGSQEERTTVNLTADPTILNDITDEIIHEFVALVAEPVKVLVISVVLAVLAVVAVACISIASRLHRWKQQSGQEKKYKLTKEVLKEFALNITKRHCQRLGNTLKLSADAIATRNEEDLKMFRTDDMLKEWVLDQECSRYEIRCRLKKAAEQCERQDIADDFISKKQSELTSTMNLQACLTNENQSPGASRSENDNLISKEESEVLTASPTKLQACLTVTNEEQSPGASGSTSDPSISRDELDCIGRYAGSSILLAFCKKYDVTVPGQQSSEGKELLSEIINVLKPTLDSEFESGNEPNTPRNTLRQLLENEQPRYACLLAKKKPFKIFNVELIDLAFRLIMADVYPFAKALNISDTVLTSYRASNIGPYNLTQGTAYILKQATANIKKQVSIDNRVKMVTPLRQAGYSEEARALYFGFEISIGDMIKVENRVNMARLAKQLGVPDDVQSTDPDNQGKSVLRRWRDTVRSSTFNHRLVLADALFSMGEEQLALDIISGVYRNREIDEQMAELLAANILGRQFPTLNKILNQTMENEEKGPAEISNELLDAGFYAHAHEYMAVSGHEMETRNVATEELRQEGITINEPEVMQERSRDGAAESKEKTTVNVDMKEQVFHHGTDTGNVASEELRQGGSTINKPGKYRNKEKKEGMGKSTNGDTLRGNTRKEGTRKGLEQVAKDTIPTEGMQEANTTEEGKGGSQKNEDKKSSGKEATDTNNLIAEISREENNPSLTNEEEVMQEKGRDGAAESKESTTENVDTKEQGTTSNGSDECQQDESSKLLIQART